MVALAELQEGTYFEMPWRPPHARFGHLQRIGSGSCHVRVPKTDEDGGWEYTHWAPGTKVLPATEQQFLTQGGSTEGTPRERSTAESPVQIVHSLCREMEGASRDTIIAECLKRGVNINTAKTQYYRWRKGL